MIGGGGFGEGAGEAAVRSEVREEAAFLRRADRHREGGGLGGIAGDLRSIDTVLMQAIDQPIAIRTDHAEDGRAGAEFRHAARSVGGAAPHLAVISLGKGLLSGAGPELETAQDEVGIQFAGHHDVEGLRHRHLPGAR